MNNWSFTGNLGKDCEVSSTQGGTAVCKFTVAVKSGYGDNAKTAWVNCRIFGKRAEGQLPQYLTKGQQVAISGECELAEWESNGTQNKALMVNVNGLDLVGRAQAANSSPQPQQPARYQQPAQPAAYQPQQQPQQPAQQPQGFDTDEDFPF